MVSTFEAMKTFVGADDNVDRAQPPMLGFVIGIGLSVVLWAFVGWIAWAVVG